MKNCFRSSLIILIIVGCWMFCACTSQKTDAIVIKGSTTMAPILERLVLAYEGHSGNRIIIESVGSMNGIKALIQKECMIASSSAPVSEDIKRNAEKNNVSLKAFTLCIDRIIPVVNVANPVHKVSRNQLNEIFTGKISNWAGLGGVDANIQIVLRHPTSGTYQVWNRKVLNETPPATNFVRVASNSGVLAAVAANKNAIGYISQAYLNPEVEQLLSENGENTPIERLLLLYVDTNRLSKGIKSFISFLHSDPAKKIIISNGFVPVQEGSN